MSNREAIARLAINEDGFAFDPRSGVSFTLNPSAQQLLAGLRNGSEQPALVQQLVTDYGLDIHTAERDVQDFLEQLQLHGLYQEAQA